MSIIIINTSIIFIIYILLLHKNELVHKNKLVHKNELVDKNIYI